MSEVRTILICTAQVPFVRGGTEVLVDSLQHELRARGYEVDRVALPFRWNPTKEILRNCMAWRLLDLTAFEGRKVDLVICTKFPSYLVKHPNKVVYLFHQFRQAYDLHGTEYGCFHDHPEDHKLRETIVGMDNRFLPRAKRIFAISGNVSRRLKHYNNLASEVLYPPPRQRARFRKGDFGDYVLYVGRLNRSKRADLLVRAFAHVRHGTRCVIAGEGEEEDALRRLAKRLNVQDRIRFAGYVTDEELFDLYANCLTVFYAPHDEDYGFTTIEAFLSGKPVITAVDSGACWSSWKTGSRDASRRPNRGPWRGASMTSSATRNSAVRWARPGPEKSGR